MTFAGDHRALSTPVASARQTCAIPYRPSASPQYTGGTWYQSSPGTCFNGLATEITFDT